jgi:Zn-dependent peptidase ImmA (M78 family)/transcriptional regulator with XRE-family HTH domain
MIDGRGDSPQLALDRLDPRRITVARELRGLTKKGLSAEIRKTPSAVSQIERGGIRPDLETLVRISMALRVPATFFMEKERPGSPIELDTCHFRAKRSVSQMMRRQSARMGDMLIDLIEWLEKQGIVFPEEDISSFSCAGDTPEEIEYAASNLRRHWGMGFGPIPSMVKLLESKGIIILPVYDACEEVDAYSTWRGKRPCIMVSLRKSASRARFDLSHELGHLIMHEDILTGDAKTERQANRFAGAFLAPWEGFLAECPRRWSLEAFKKLKFRWKMSVSALLYRAKDLGCLSASAYRRAMIDMGMRNLRKNEGPEWPIECPTLLTQALELLQDKITLDEAASELTLYSSELRRLLEPCVSEEVLEKIDREPDEDEGKIVSFRPPKAGAEKSDFLKKSDLFEAQPATRNPQPTTTTPQ